MKTYKFNTLLSSEDQTKFDTFITEERRNSTRSKPKVKYSGHNDTISAFVNAEVTGFTDTNAIFHFGQRWAMFKRMN